MLPSNGKTKEMTVANPYIISGFLWELSILVDNADAIFDGVQA